MELKQVPFHAQSVEIHLALGQVGSAKKFSTIDVTKYLEELHAEVQKQGLTPLSFTVISGYAPHWIDDKAVTNNVAILKAAWVIGDDLAQPDRELDFYCTRLVEKFEQSSILVFIPDAARAVGYIRTNEKAGE